MFTASLKVYPETKGVPLEEMDIVFGEGIYRFLGHNQISDQSFFFLHIILGNKHARYSSGGGPSRWFNRIFTKDGGSSSSDNRMRTFTEGEGSYTPLRADHDPDHDQDEVQDDDENDGEEYEMIKRNPVRDNG